MTNPTLPNADELEVVAPERLILQPCPTYGWEHPDRVPRLRPIPGRDVGVYGGPLPQGRD
jgi:hypothetical protein